MINHLEITNFRRFNKQQFDLSKKVLIVGPNSKGKTSILEALNIISIAKSHQTKNMLDVIKFNEEFSRIKAVDDNSNEYLFITNKKGKVFYFNKQEIKLMSDYIGKLKVLFFSPYDMNLIKGSPLLRRNFLNMQISQINNLYLKNLINYNNLLKERNILLKQPEEKIDLNLLKVITKQMIDLSKLIMQERIEFINQVNKVINLVHNKINDKEIIRVEYLNNLDFNNIEQNFKDHLQSDIKNQQTEIGVQRDDIIFYLNEKDVSKFASLGQIRSVILSLQLSLCILYKQKYNEYPLLLLDDVFGELDNSRINNLLKIINNLGQVIISTVSIDGINNDLLNTYQIINLGE